MFVGISEARILQWLNYKGGIYLILRIYNASDGLHNKLVFNISQNNSLLKVAYIYCNTNNFLMRKNYSQPAKQISK